MSKTCPNCNHSVRPDARYCGFCGANLAAFVESKSSTPPVKQDKTGTNQNSKPAKLKRFSTSQKVTFLAIILLVLLITASVVCRYWSEISQALVQLLFSLYVRAL
jgi:uncharacterized membrane protein YvbJ